MIIKVVPAFFICIFLFFSCASHASEDSSNATTLKSTAERFDASTNWTKTIEENLLSQNYSDLKGVSGKLDASLDVLPASKAFCEGKKIYPVITGAYSLDTSEMTEKCFSAVDEFLKAFENGQGLENYFETSSVYSLVMFKYDFQRLFGDAKVSWHAVGEPFCGDKYIQCPARLFFEDEKNFDGEHADIMIFVRNGEAGYRIVSVDLLNSTGE